MREYLEILIVTTGLEQSDTERFDMFHQPETILIDWSSSAPLESTASHTNMPSFRTPISLIYTDGG